MIPIYFVMIERLYYQRFSPRGILTSLSSAEHLQKWKLNVYGDSIRSQSVVPFDRLVTRWTYLQAHSGEITGIEPVAL